MVTLSGRNFGRLARALARARLGLDADADADTRVELVTVEGDGPGRSLVLRVAKQEFTAYPDLAAALAAGVAEADAVLGFSYLAPNVSSVASISI